METRNLLIKQDLIFLKILSLLAKMENFNLEIDCYSPKLKLGVEYNGAQHYKFIPHFHKNKEALEINNIEMN